MKVLVTISVSLIISSCSNSRPGDTETRKQPLTKWGDRAMVVGDFDGNHQIDTLRERYLSGLTNRETNKYFDVPFDSMVSLVVLQRPYIQVVSSGSSFDTLTVEETTGQLFGLSYLVNIGDNNHNARDEIATVVDYADWSSINFLLIYELSDKLGWLEKGSYEIRDYDNADSLISRDDRGGLIIHSYKQGEKIDTLIEVASD